MVQGTWSGKLLWVGWLLVGCGPAPYCITSLGVEVTGMYMTAKPIEAPGYTCQDFDTVEAEITALLPDNPAMNIDWSRVKGYRLSVHPERKWIEVFGRSVAGFTNCPLMYLEIGTSDPHVARSAYTHELLHAAQGCYTPLPTDDGLDRDHSNWNRDGLYNATNVVAGMH